MFRNKQNDPTVVRNGRWILIYNSSNRLDTYTFVADQPGSDLILRKHLGSLPVDAGDTIKIVEATENATFGKTLDELTEMKNDKLAS